MNKGGGGYGDSFHKEDRSVVIFQVISDSKDHQLDSSSDEVEGQLMNDIPMAKWGA